MKNSTLNALVGAGAITNGNTQYFCTYFNIYTEEMSMYGYSCEKCGCTLDPGEGSICEECLEEADTKKQRQKEFDRMIRSKDYKQMNMEEFLK